MLKIIKKNYLFKSMNNESCGKECLPPSTNKLFDFIRELKNNHFM